MAQKKLGNGLLIGLIITNTSHCKTKQSHHREYGGISFNISVSKVDSRENEEIINNNSFTICYIHKCTDIRAIV